jgi:hypothetical protein
VLRNDNLYARYAETIAQWEDVFGRERITVLPYAETHDILDGVLGVIRADPSTLPRSRPRRDNKSLGPRRTALLRAVNGVTTTPDGSDRGMTWPGLAWRGLAWRGLAWRGLGWRAGRVAQVVARHGLQALGGAVDGQWRLDAHRLNRLRTIAETDQAWLASRYGVVLDLPPRQERAAGDHAPLARALA